MNMRHWGALLPLILLPIRLIAQVSGDPVQLKSWQAPLYWQPSQTERAAFAERLDSLRSDLDAATPPNSLVFVGMTPCRVADTRTGSGFTGAFGPPSLVGGANRTFPIQSSTACAIPSIAQAYSFNITVVPPGFLNFITVWPTGQPRPNASTLNGYVGTVIANSAIVPAGTSGSVDVFASENTNLIIDINGYYALQSGITLGQGSAAAPSLSFSGDPGTGIFSPAAGTLNIAAGGTTRFSVASNGNVNVTGNLDVSGSETIGNTLGIGTTTPAGNLHVKGGSPVRVIGDTTTLSASEYVDFFARSSLFASDLGGMRIQRRAATGDIDTSIWAAANGNAATERIRINGNGNVGIGTNDPHGNLEIAGFKALIGLTDTSSNRRTDIQNDTGTLDFYTGLTSQPFPLPFPSMSIQANTGNVGIGLIDPGYKLDVADRIRVRQGQSGSAGVWLNQTTVGDRAFIGMTDNNHVGFYGTGTGWSLTMDTTNGTTSAKVLQITGGSDVAENFEVDDGIRPGMVVAIDPQNSGKLTLARGAYNRRAAGVISGANNVSAGMVLPDPNGALNSRALTLSGRVWVYCDASRNSVRPGDLLTTSETPGHAMKVTNHSKAQGAIIGKALTGLKSGRGLVLVLASLQ
jgi:hypothetical protein